MRISSHSTSSDINIKLDEISNELKEIGINYVGHGVVNYKGEHTGYFSDRQWGNVYIEKGYFFSDPVLQVFDQSPMKIIDWFIVENMTKNNKILHERIQHTGIVGGITLVSQLQNHIEFLNLGFSKKISTTKYLLKHHMLLNIYAQMFRQYHTYQRI
jgi:hypothetical protein